MQRRPSTSLALAGLSMLWHVSSPSIAQVGPPDLSGTWVAGKFGWVGDASKINDRYGLVFSNRDGSSCGSLGWLRRPNDDGRVKRDEKNPNDQLRDRPLLGLTVLHDLKWKDGKFKNMSGRFYFWPDGKYVTVNIELKESEKAEICSLDGPLRRVLGIGIKCLDLDRKTDNEHKSLSDLRCNWRE